MRVVHINASDRHGGAALAAWRLNASLRERGVASQLLVETRTTADTSVEVVRRPGAAASADATANAAVGHVYRDCNRTPVSNTHFSMQIEGVDLRQHPLVQEADVIHLHWVSSFLSPQSIQLLQSVDKPIVWTLHDFAPFTGGCHFPAGCDGYTAACARCPQLRNDPFHVPAAVLQDKVDLLCDLDLTLIAPSAWMAERARESRLFQRAKRLSVIPNCVDTRIFDRRTSAESRRWLGLSPNVAYVLYVADRGRQSRKGIELLSQIMRVCAEDVRVQSAQVSLLVVGHESPSLDPDCVPIRRLGHLETEQQMAMAYSAVDVVVLPSLEDNLPNVAIEALACGAPLVAFDVGGISEIAVDGAHGRIVRNGDVTCLAQAIASMLSDPAAFEQMRVRGRSRVEADYSYPVVADQHLDLYAAALRGRRRISRARVAPDPGPAMSALLPDLRLYCLAEVVGALQKQLVDSEVDRRAQLRVIDSLGTAAQDRLRLIERLDTELDQRGTLIEQLHRDLADRLQLIERLDSELEQRGALIDRLDAALTARAALTQWQQSELAARGYVIERIEAELQNQKRVIEQKTAELAVRLDLIERLDRELKAGQQRMQLDANMRRSSATYLYGRIRAFGSGCLRRIRRLVP